MMERDKREPGVKNPILDEIISELEDEENDRCEYPHWGNWNNWNNWWT